MGDEQPLPPGMAVLWRRPDDRARPGRRPGLTLAQITQTGIDLADAEGLAAVSMARVAQRLGVTTMALYRYVAGKDELLALMHDGALAPPPLRRGDRGPWRERLTAWCWAQLDVLAAHPWAVQLGAVPPVGPNRVRWIERGLAALEDTPLPVDRRVALVGMLSLHVFAEGQRLAALTDQVSGRATPPHPALVDYTAVLRTVVDAQQHPRIADALSRGAFDGAIDDDGRAHHELALTVLLDGAAALVARFEE